MALTEFVTAGSVFIWIILSLILGIIYWYKSVPDNLPPGSAGLPILGYVPFVGKPVHRAFNRLAKKYGPIFHLYLGNRLLIVLNDWEAIKEALVKQPDIFAGRIRDANFVRSEKDRHGVVNSDGEHWRQQRRFILSNLRTNGVGKLSLEPLLLNEIRYFMGTLKKHCGKPTAMRDPLYCSLSNNVHLLVTGNRYTYDQPTIQRMIRALFSFAEHGQQIAFHTFFPWISYIPGSNIITGYKERWQDMDEMMAIAKGIIDDTKRDRQAQYDCLCDCYLEEIKAAETNPKSVFSMSGLLHVCRDLLSAGAETTSRTLLWGMLYLTNNPKVQKKVQEEIDKVIGQDREPSYNDRSNTPYTVAMITEVHRIASIVPLGLPRRNTQETKILGYTIPKNTMIVTNIWNSNNDPRLWGDPENFRPERFIGPDGRLDVPEYFIPFSVGKRQCAGEPLARMELYLYFTSLLQKLDFISPDGSKLPLDSSDKVTRAPIFDVICFKEREID